MYGHAELIVAALAQAAAHGGPVADLVGESIQVYARSGVMIAQWDVPDGNPVASLLRHGYRVVAQPQADRFLLMRSEGLRVVE